MIITKFKKNRIEDIVVSMHKYNDEKIISLWVWRNLSEGGSFPTKRGLAFPVSFFPKFKKEIDKLGKKIQKKEDEENNQSRQLKLPF